MPFKTILESARCPALAEYAVVEVRGVDAAAFLQAQTMNDVATLAPGRWQWNGLLSAKGRVLALFALVRVAADRFLLVVPDVTGADVVAHLRRFVFRSKLTLAECTAFAAAAGPAAASSDPGAVAGDADVGLALDFGGEGGPRWLWLLPPSHPSLAAADATTDADWRALDLMHGLPRLPPGQREAFTPQMLSLERLGAFSLKKGCYPGQEIVARTHYLGQAKRALVRLSGAGLRAGQPVLAAGAAAGTVACATARGDTALAVLALDAGDPLTVDELPCRRETLFQGLSRPG